MEPTPGGFSEEHRFQSLVDDSGSTDGCQVLTQLIAGVAVFMLVQCS